MHHVTATHRLLCGGSSGEKEALAWMREAGPDSVWKHLRLLGVELLVKRKRTGVSWA